MSRRFSGSNLRRSTAVGKITYNRPKHYINGIDALRMVASARVNLHFHWQGDGVLEGKEAPSVQAWEDIYKHSVAVVERFALDQVGAVLMTTVPEYLAEDPSLVLRDSLEMVIKEVGQILHKAPLLRAVWTLAEDVLHLILMLWDLLLPAGALEDYRRRRDVGKRRDHGENKG